MPRLLGTFTVTNNTPFTIPCGAREAIGAVILKNLSGFELQVQFGSCTDIIAAHSYERLDVGSLASWDSNITVTPQMLASNAANAPSQILVATAYAPGEPISAFYPMAIDRLSNVGNTVNTSGSNTLKNDGNSPGTQIIESTPSDQAVSAFNLNNDGSGTWQVLSANVQRIIAQITRGNNTTGKAVIHLGDGNDSTITTLYGSVQGNQPAALGATTLASNARLSVPLDTTAANQTPVRLGPDAHSLADWMFIVSMAGDLILWDNKNARNVTVMSLANGGFGQIGGQATVGALGAPVIVAQTIDQAVTTTTDQIILSFTPGSTGLYRVSGWVYVNTTAVSTNLTFRTTYTNPHGGTPTAYFVTTESPSRVLNASATAGPGAAGISCMPQVIYAAGGSAITVHYVDSAATPADNVSALIERLS